MNVVRNVLSDKDALRAVEKFLNQNVSKDPTKHPVYGKVLSTFRSMSCTCSRDGEEGHGWDAHEQECNFHDSAFTIADMTAGLAMVVLQSDLLPFVLPLVGSAALLAAAHQDACRKRPESNEKDPHQARLLEFVLHDAFVI